MRKMALWMMAAALFAACHSNDKTDGLMTIDLNQYYPEKELTLQDFMEVEYVPLESTDQFITSANIKAVGEKYFVLVSDKKILLFDRKTGKGIRVIERIGQGAEEYTLAYNVILDEENNELFVNDPIIKKICVYDLEGKFKRSFSHGETHEYVDVTDFDNDFLICYDETIFMQAEKGEKDNYDSKKGP